MKGCFSPSLKILRTQDRYRCWSTHVWQHIGKIELFETISRKVRERMIPTRLSSSIFAIAIFRTYSKRLRFFFRVQREALKCFFFFHACEKNRITSTVCPASSTVRRCAIADIGRPVFASPPAPTPWTRSWDASRERFSVRLRAKSREAESSHILR